MTYIQDAALDELRRRIELADGNQSAAAERLGVSPAEITNALKGYRPMSERLLNKLGYARITAAVRQDKVKQVIEQVRKVQ